MLAELTMCFNIQNTGYCDRQQPEKDPQKAA